MAVDPCEEVQGTDVYKISFVTQKEIINPQCPALLAFLSFLEVPSPTENQMFLDAHHNCKNDTVLQIESADRCSPCRLDINIEKETLETRNTGERTVRSSIKYEGALTRALWKKFNLQIGGKIMQLLMNHGIMLPNCTFRDNSTTERTPDTPCSRWRRCKRAASFDSRKILLFFSILSSMGTMVLIYLTLRLKLIEDGLDPV